MQGEDYAIITSVKYFYNWIDWVFYFFSNALDFCKYFVYKFKKSPKVNKYRRKLFDDIHNEVIFGKEYPIIGHPQLERSLLRGFLELNISFKMNEPAKNMILLWVDKSDLHCLKRVKKQYDIQNIVTVPTACKYDYKDLMWNFPCYDVINYALVASHWVKDKMLAKIPQQYHNKVKEWASGVELHDITKNYPFRSIICYYKNLPIDNDLTMFITNKGINCVIVEYGKYYFNDWIEQLKQNDMVIFYQNCHETQGLAIAEAWSYNCPTLIKMIDDNTCASPYLTSITGKTWKDASLQDLKEIISDYAKNPQEFLKSFSARDYIKNNMSDVVSVKNLINIFEGNA